VSKFKVGDRVKSNFGGGTAGQYCGTVVDIIAHNDAYNEWIRVNWNLWRSRDVTLPYREDQLILDVSYKNERKLRKALGLDDGVE